MNDQTTPPRKLLVVDDDRELADSLVRALETAGYSAAAAYNAEDAVSFVSNGAPDLVVLDIRMPGLSGIKLSELLKQQFAVPFVFLSVANDDDTVRQATAVGALAYLVKPMDMRQCIPAISAALARADDVNALRKNESQLAAAIEQTRKTSVVVGLLMERLRVGP